MKTVTHYFIGEGSEGCVIGDHTNPNFVSKIGFIYPIITEFKNIKCLPLHGPWVHPNEVELFKIDPKDVNDVLSLCPNLKETLKLIIDNPENDPYPPLYPPLFLHEVEFFNPYDNIYEMRMPFIKGIPYRDYLAILQNNSATIIQKPKFSKHGYKYRNITFSIPDEIIFKLLKALSNLYYELERLYNQYYIDYGNDLHGLNMLYNEETNTINLIDWTRLKIGDTSKTFSICKTALDMSNMFEEVLLSGVFSDIILQWLIDHNIIKNISYDEINFKDNIVLIDKKDLISVVSEYI